MIYDRGWGFRGALAAAVSGTFLLCAGAQAQTAAPGAGLRQQLADLAANPQSVSELIATGRAALAMGDGQAALGFFTRAGQLAPADPRVKAGLAAANVRAGRPETALTLFAEAASLGAPESELLADRGLAYDMIGQTARAQQDYLAALRHRDDAEVRRRLALSLAISGQRAAALRLIEPQLQSGDRAAQRTRIMVHALTGDAQGARTAASSALTAQQAGALTPFLTRLASLSPGDMAAAANLGRVPGNQAIRQAAVRMQADPAALAFAGGGASTLPVRLPVAVADASPRRRPGGVTGAASTPGQRAADRNNATAAARDAGRPRGSWTNAASTAMARLPVATSEATASSPNALVLPHPHEPLRISAAALEGAGLAGAASSGPRVPAAASVDTQAVSRSVAAPVQLVAAYQPEPDPIPADAESSAEGEPADGAAANLAVWNRAAAPAPVAVEATVPSATEVRARPSQPSPVVRRETAPAPVARRGFSDVAATVSSLQTETPAATTPQRQTAPAARTANPRSRTAAPAARTAAQTPAATRATNNAARASAASRAATPRQAHPSRIWVQLGVSNNRAGFNYELTRMRRTAPELARQTAYTATLGSNHRLLVGPFPTDAAARTFINTLRQKDIPSLAWTSTAGTQVERLPAGR